jgi:mannose-1-phosphate guanylyltransferase / phosphomannomutase
VWESMGARSLFGRDGVRGLANVDISPELAVRLSMAWASTFEKGSTVTTSRDTSRAARVLKRAIMVGCNAAGINVDDLEAATVPVTRFQTTTSDSMAGVTVRLAPDDPQSVVLRFFDKEGIDVDETTQRKIERLYHREDFRRVLAREIGDIDFPPRSLEHYTAALIDSVDLSNARSADLKLVLDYSFGTSSFVMPNLLAKLEAEVLVVNPYANTANVLAFDRPAAAARVSELVRASGAHLGAVLDPGGEFVDIVDDLGHTLSHDEALLVLVTLVTEAVPGARIALPVAASGAAERICRGAGAEIVWTKLSASHLMDVARSEKVTLAASQSGGFIFPAFLPAFDGAATLVNLIALLTSTGRKLSDVVAAMPPVRIAHQSVHTPWDQKGMLMRTLVERSQERELVLVDGVKVIEDDGWALVLPDPEEPLTHVWAEAPSAAQAEARVQEYATRLEQLLH